MHQITSSRYRFECCCWSTVVCYLRVCSTSLFRNRSQKNRLDPSMSKKASLPKSHKRYVWSRRRCRRRKPTKILLFLLSCAESYSHILDWSLLSHWSIVWIHLILKTTVLRGLSHWASILIVLISIGISLRLEWLLWRIT